MDIDNKLKEELHQHTLAMKEQEKLEARLLGESDYFNRIVEMNTEVERRKFAAMAMQGLLANCKIVPNPNIPDEDMPKLLAEMCVKIADALIAELNKKKE